MRAVALVAACAALAVSGCASSKKGAGAAGIETNPSAVGKGGMGETSLQQLQSGTLGGGTGGPLKDIHFAFDQFTIDPQDGAILKNNADWLMAHPKTRVQVEGHCDERGAEDYNIALGAKRAQAAKDYLVTLGISGGRITTISYGKELPLCTEHEENCWGRNRRDHFVVSQ